MVKKTTKKTADEAEPKVLEEPGAAEKAAEEKAAKEKAAEAKAAEAKAAEAKAAEEAEAVMAEQAAREDQNVWLRGLWMLVLAALFGVGEGILALAAVLQFLWILFAKEKNEPIAAFGRDLSDWLARVALFQTGSTEEKPFPFTKWGRKG